MTKKRSPVKVRVHSCFDWESGETLASVCACCQAVTQKEAKAMVRQEQAVWLQSPKGASELKICLLGGSEEFNKSALNRRTPRSATIDQVHMERAYVDNDLEERIRINLYGQMNASMLQSLIKIVPRERWIELYREHTDHSLFSVQYSGPYPVKIDDETASKRTRILKGIE